MPPLVVFDNAAPYDGLAGLGAPLDCRECREDVETFRRKHDEIRQQIKELLDFDAFIQSVEI